MRAKSNDRYVIILCGGFYNAGRLGDVKTVFRYAARKYVKHKAEQVLAAIRAKGDITAHLEPVTW